MKALERSEQRATPASSPPPRNKSRKRKAVHPPTPQPSSNTGQKEAAKLRKQLAAAERSRDQLQERLDSIRASALVTLFAIALATSSFFAMRRADQSNLRSAAMALDVIVCCIGWFAWHRASAETKQRPVLPAAVTFVGAALGWPLANAVFELVKALLP